MRQAFHILLVCSFLRSGFSKDEVAAKAEADEDYVEVLTKSNWDETLKKHKRVLVQFWVPGEKCVDCDVLSGDFSKTSKMLKAEQLSSIVAKVDASVETELADRYNITKYPTLKYFADGKFVKNFDGRKRDLDGLTLWLKNKEDPPVKEITAEKLQSFLDDIDEEEYGLVAHVQKKSVRAKAFFASVEERLREWDIAKIHFAVVWLPKDADPKADAKLFMHRPGIMSPDPERIDYTSSVWSEDKITWWAQNGSYPTLGKKFTRNAYAPQSMDAMDWTAAVIGLVDDHTEKEGEEPKDEPLKPTLTEALTPFAVENPQWKFVLADIEKLEDHELQLLGVKLGDHPRLIMLTDRKRYHLVGEDEIIVEETVRQFFEDVKNKAIKPHYKSTEAPVEDHDKDGVQIIVGDTFDDIAMQEDKDVFVMFYAPWCEHSKKLRPTWGKLAKKAKEDGWDKRGIVIAKMDAGANECEDYVESWPKMVLYPAVGADMKYKKKAQFTGDRTVEELSAFLEANAVSLQDEDSDNEESSKKSRRKRRRKKSSEEL